MAIDISLLTSTNPNNIDTNFQRVAAALQDAVGRSGEQPNQMNADLDLNSNDLLNGGAANFDSLLVDGVDVHDLTGSKGWSPVFSTVARGSDIVMQLIDYVGGGGSKPTEYIGQYVGSGGYVTDINQAVAFNTNAVIDGVKGDVTVSGSGTIWTVNLNTISYTSPATGATARNVKAKLDDIVTVKDFGAVGNGIVDDTVALQAALDSNRLVYMPPGRYRITKTLIASPVRNRGNGFIGLGVPSNYPETTQGSGPAWDGKQEPVIFYDGPSHVDLIATSATNVGLVVGTRGFTTQAGKAFALGQTIVIRRTSAPNTTYMYGTVLTYDAGTGALTADITYVSTTGTFNDWSLSVPTACLAVLGAEPLTIEPDNTFANTAYGFTFRDVICHANDKASFGLYIARLQKGDIHGIVGYKARVDGIYINGVYSGNYQHLLGYRNWGRGISIGAATLDYGWLTQGSINRVTFFDMWGYVNGRAGEYVEADTTLRRRGCGIYFAPHRGCAMIGWTAELNDGVGIVFGPTGNSNEISNGYTELNSSNDITGSGSAIFTGRATEQRGIMFFGNAGGASYNSMISNCFLAGEKIQFTGTSPTDARDGVIVTGTTGAGVVASYPNYFIGNGCSAELVTVYVGSRPHSHGVWTPSLGGNTSTGTGWAYTTQDGWYSRKGDMVFFSGRIILSAVSANATGQIQINGLPFPLENGVRYQSPVSIRMTTLTTAVVSVSGVAVNNNSYISLYRRTAASTAEGVMVLADLAATTVIEFSGSYRRAL